MAVLFFVGLYVAATLLSVLLHVARGRLSLAPVFGLAAVLTFVIWHLTQIGWWVRWSGLSIDAAILGPYPAILCGAALTSAFDGMRATRIYVMTVFGAAVANIAYLEFLSSLSDYTPLPSIYYLSVAQQAIEAGTISAGVFASAFFFDFGRRWIGSPAALSLSIYVGLLVFLSAFALFAYGPLLATTFVKRELAEFGLAGLLPSLLLLIYGAIATRRNLFMPARPLASLLQVWKTTDRALGEVHEDIVRAKETISELRTLNRALKTEQELRIHQMESSPLAILEVDQRHRVIRTNDAARRLLSGGVSAGDDIHDTLPGFEVFSKDRTRLSGTLSIPIGDEIQPRRIQLTVLPVFNRNYGPSFSLVIQDITEREMESFRQSVKRRVRDIHMAGRVITHDLSNLLLAIEGNASILALAPQLQHESSRAVETIRAACLRCRDMVTQMGTQLQVFGLPDPRSVTVRELVDEAVHLQWANALSAEVKLSIDHDDESEIWIDADRTQMVRVLINLVGNAVRATQSGGTVQLICRQERYKAVIDIVDSGRGMSAGQLEKAFEPGFSTKGAGQGGLGLAISWLMVDAHGGQLTLASREGHGTTASINLPLSGTLAEVHEEPA